MIDSMIKQTQHELDSLHEKKQVLAASHEHTSNVLNDLKNLKELCANYPSAAILIEHSDVPKDWRNIYYNNSHRTYRVGAGYLTKAIAEMNLSLRQNECHSVTLPIPSYNKE